MIPPKSVESNTINSDERQERRPLAAPRCPISASIPVLSYHAISTQRSAIAITPAVFQQQMSWLYQNGYQVVSVSKLVRWLEASQSLPARTVGLTFDDGFESIYTHAFPTLADFGFAATIFLVSEYCGQFNDWPSQPSFIPRYKLLGWPQVREMARYGFEFGAHTQTHPRLDQIDLGRVGREVLSSKATIEDELGQFVTSFAYPYGFYNTSIKRIVEQHFAAACSTYLGLVTSDSDPFALERIEGSYLASTPVLRLFSSSIFPKYIGIRRFLRTLLFRLTTRAWR